MNQDQQKSPSAKEKYKFTAIRKNYEDYSSGRVIFGVPGATNFPVRLSSEIFQRCADYLTAKGNAGPYTIYDPFCGVAYSLTALGFLHGKNIKKIYASDADKTILEFASKNLSLLNETGLEKRIIQFQKLILEYNKPSHQEALDSAHRLKSRIQELNLTTEIFQHNILTDDQFPQNMVPLDMMITDLPYGKLTNWEGLIENANPIHYCLERIKYIMSIHSIVALSCHKAQQISHEGYHKILSLNIGKRKVVLMAPGQNNNKLYI